MIEQDGCNTDNQSVDPGNYDGEYSSEGEGFADSASDECGSVSGKSMDASEQEIYAKECFLSFYANKDIAECRRGGGVAHARFGDSRPPEQIWDRSR